MYPQRKHVTTNRCPPLPLFILTRAVRPGTSGVLHFLQYLRFTFLGSLSRALAAIRKARSTYLLANSSSVSRTSLASLSRIAILSLAISSICFLITRVGTVGQLCAGLYERSHAEKAFRVHSIHRIRGRGGRVAQGGGLQWCR